MRLYKQLSGIRFLAKNYSLKFLFIAFIGIHIPLIGIIIYLIFKTEDHISPMSMFVLTLVLTLSATGLTLFLLNQLLVPIKLAKDTLVNYIDHDEKPDLPAGYKDEAGILMQSVQLTISRLRELDVERSDLLSLLSHDLRTPLTQIISINKLIKDDDKEQKMKQYTSMIDYCVENQLKLVQYIFMMMKMKDHSIKQNELVPLNLSSIISRQIKLIESKASDKQITIKSHADASMMILANEMMFERVIFNLLTNAIKFSHINGLISIETRQQGTDLQILVKDQGIGFEQSNADNLFKRFTLSGRKGTSGEHSEGLGLYLCRRIVKQHHGTLEAFSEGADQGATFIITLPLPV